MDDTMNDRQKEILEVLSRFRDGGASAEDIWAALKLQSAITANAAMLKLLYEHKVTVREIPASEDIEEVNFYKVI